MQLMKSARIAMCLVVLVLGLILSTDQTAAQEQVQNQSLATTTGGAKTGDVFTVTTVKHQDNGPDIRTADEQYMLYLSWDRGTTRIVPNIHGTPLGWDEPFKQYNQVPAVFTFEDFTTIGSWGCFWDKVTSRVFQKTLAGTIDSRHVGDVHVSVFRHKASGKAYVLYMTEVKNDQGRIFVKETYRMRRTDNGQYLRAGQDKEFPPEPGSELVARPAGDLIKTIPYWIKLDEPFLMEPGRFEDYVLRPGCSDAETALIYGYDVVMGTCPFVCPDPPVQACSLNGTLDNWTGKVFCFPLQFSDGSWLLPTHSLGDMYGFITARQRGMTWEDRRLFQQVFYWINQRRWR